MADAGAKSDFDKEGIRNVLVVAVVVCLVCSIVVASAAVNFRPAQQANRELDRMQNILRAAGMLPAGATVDAQGRDVEELFTQFTVRAVDLASGRFLPDFDVAGFNQLRSARADDTSRALDRGADIATLGRVENVSLVYLKEGDEGIERIVLPVRGYGLWGTMFGYLALEADLDTVAGLAFYEHKETPGLGGEIDNDRWKAQWPGVRLMGVDGPAVQLVKTRSAAGSDAAASEVDALSGATLTSRGVENLIRFWAGELGYGPFLKNLKAEAA